MDVPVLTQYPCREAYPHQKRTQHHISQLLRVRRDPRCRRRSPTGSCRKGRTVEREQDGHPAWHEADTTTVIRELDVRFDRGLSPEAARERLRTHGPNRLETAKKESAIQAWLRQYRDFMQIVLLAAAVISLVVTRDVGTFVVLAGLTVFNAVIGLRQEAKAEESVKALSRMMKTVARVRRDGQAVEIDAEELVPGDVVLVEAGDRIPADGRICVAASLEIEEAALTGESLPVAKRTDPVPGKDVPLGDRTCLGYMNTSVTRGRGEMVVTTTGMGTEIGHIAGLLAGTEAEKTPLQKQLDSLSKIIATIAGIALALVVVLGLLQGKPFDVLFITGVALAVAAIPTGLPAVVTALLSIGTQEIARRNAIMKRLPAVETLGSTSAVCSDKTGTLTLNKMTARELVIPGLNRFTVSGEGYGTAGEIKHVAGAHIDLDPYLLPMILCADAVLDGDTLIGDPTEGALIVLAAKGGLDVESTRGTYPRVGEVPFDADYKFMATFHQMTGANGEPVVRCYVKGAPDVLISRGTSYRSPDGTLVTVTDENRPLALEANDRMARAGERVMVVAQRDLAPAAFDPGADLIDLVRDLTLLAMVGIVDPPRSEARAAIAECAQAGIRVRMITGDHVTTAGAIAAELRIPGRAITGAEFASLSDEELRGQLDDIGVIARVSPEDKLRLVRLLKQDGNVVAMTGDGVNDAPALKAADIGVAMGITGTEVSKEAAVMILTDDNFATIVGAVEYGRSLYDNLLKYLRFQMSTLVAYIAIFIGAAALGVAGGIPLTPLQILWVNMLVDIPVAVALGFDEPTRGLMSRPPRPVGAPVLSRANWVRLCFQGFVMTAGSLAAYQIGARQGGAAVASTMLLTTLSLFHVAAGLLARDQTNTIFSRAAIPGPTQLRRYALALILIIAVTGIGLLQRVFGTTELSGAQWAACAGLAASLVVVEELVKLVLRHRRPRGRVVARAPRAVSLTPGS
ncbi:cation-transporting P-type ATPase [Nonomuraea sp. 3-1Str]|nr:cation-transporting P-type ATPase [Nonomuraea sp. 3-1Str]